MDIEGRFCCSTPELIIVGVFKFGKGDRARPVVIIRIGHNKKMRWEQCREECQPQGRKQSSGKRGCMTAFLVAPLRLLRHVALCCDFVWNQDLITCFGRYLWLNSLRDLTSHRRILTSYSVMKFVNYRDKGYGIMIPVALISYIISIALENKPYFLPKTLSSSHYYNRSLRAYDLVVLVGKLSSGSLCGIITCWAGRLGVQRKSYCEHK